MNAVIKMYKDGDSLSVNELIEKGSIIDLDVGDGLGNQIFNAPDLIGLDFDITIWIGALIITLIQIFIFLFLYTNKSKRIVFWV